MKKLLCILCLLLALVCVFAACNKTETPNPGSNNDNTQNEQGGETPEGGETPDGGDETPAPGPHTHTWSAWETITAATCGTAGQQKRVCACGESETQSIPATGSCVYNTQNVCTVCGVALQYTDGLAYTLNSDGESYTVKQGTALNHTTDIVIPWYHEGKPVTVIGDQAFQNIALTSITIPGSVTSIGYDAFRYCDSLTSITIPVSVTSIDSYAFYDCVRLTSITIPASVTSIGRSAFSDCDSLASVTFGENSQLTSIDNYAFYECVRLTSITIPASVTSIGNSAFQYCTSLTSITIPASVTSIGSYAFEDCTRLTSITIPASVTSIGDDAFRYCHKLIEIYNLSSLDITAGSSGNGNVGYFAKDIYTDATAQSNLFAENDYIFYDDGTNRYLMGYTGTATELTLPVSCKGNTYEIYKYAFYHRDDIISITIPSSVTSIGESAFSGCTSLTSVTFGENSQLTSIGNDAFYSCDSLTSITIPASVTSIGSGAFEDCTSLTSVTFGENSQLTGISDEAFRDCNSLTSITIPASVTSIGEIAFYGCTSLTSITIPASVTSIGYVAFSGCDSLASVTFGENSQLTSIGSYAFYSCDSLTSITIPSSVTSIGGGAFEDCTSLTSVTFGENSQLTGISDEAFRDCNSLTSITIPASVTSIGYYAFYDCVRLTSITIPASVTSIGRSAFSGCDSLASVTFGENSQLTSIDNYAFYGCTSLTSVTFGENSQLTSIDNCAFYECVRLTSITIPASVTSIGNSAFQSCYKLIEIYNLSSLDITAGSSRNGYVGYYAKDIYTDATAQSNLFAENDYIFYDDGTNRYLMGYTGTATELTLPTSCKGNTYEIYKYAFYHRDDIISITIPSSVTSIGSYAFSGCHKLIEIYNLSSLDITTGALNNGYVGEYAKDIYTDATAQSNLFAENDYIFYDDGTNRYLMGYTGTATELTLPVSCKGNTYEIYKYAFYHRDDIISITIPSSVTSINSAFYGCTSLTSITIPASVTSIDSYAFYDCVRLTSITIPASVTSIGRSAFSGCDSLASVTFGENSQLTSIGNDAFYSCDSLTSITIPSSVTSIGYDAFRYCDSLTSVTFENTTGWWVSTSSSATSGTSVDVSVPTNNDGLLVSTYYNYYWKRTVA